MRRIRRWLAAFIYWQWKKMGKLSAIAYHLLRLMNGKHGD